jgi:nicotinamidase-related amidase
MSNVPYKRLNKDDAVVLLVDHQTGLISLVQDFSPNEFKNNVLALADIAKFFKSADHPHHQFRCKARTARSCRNCASSSRMRRSSQRPGQINAWDNEDFVKAIKATGRKQLIIAGVVTDVCVAFPTLSCAG